MITAVLLKERGYRVLAVHMILRPDDPPEPCHPVIGLTSRIDIPLHVVDLRCPFHRHVIKPFLAAYRLGTTPNPCVICNPTIKFSLLREKAAELGGEMLATGHYARTVYDKSCEIFRLFRARDRSKDQSYFLYGLNQQQLAQAFFPLGDFRKSEVQRLATDAGMSGYHREESQEICFISDRDYRAFLEEHLSTDLPGPGPVVDLQGRQLGEHRGIHRYTVGQRRGISIPSSAPYYVVRLEPETNTVRVGRKSDLDHRKLLVTEVNWIAGSPPASETEALVQVRSRHREAPALLTVDGNHVVVTFSASQKSITPGQSAVFYSGQEVLGGGIIEQVIS
jgi:tRNA-specific 2-thiouridylase